MLHCIDNLNMYWPDLVDLLNLLDGTNLHTCICTDMVLERNVRKRKIVWLSLKWQLTETKWEWPETFKVNINYTIHIHKMNIALVTKIYKGT